MMRAKFRRTLGMTITGIYLFGYIFLAASVGSLFQSKPAWGQLLYFAIAGLIWVFPLKPLFMWMRTPDADELPKEAPPIAAKPSAKKRGK